MRKHHQKANQLRPVSFELDYVNTAAGSCLISMGDTRVLCCASLENVAPKWMAPDSQSGWVTGEYSMLPCSSRSRIRRETNGLKGRTQEIQRLIGRALRASVDLGKLGPRTVTIDCDVLQADGGTRTAAITGGYIALRRALEPLILSGEIPQEALLNPVAAVSVGITSGFPLLDLCYEEDVSVDVDANFVLTKAGELVEVQGTAEGKPFSKDQFLAMLELAESGVQQLIEMQIQALSAPHE
ncbi:MAG: ribonuclease PH [Bdellovibrionales bacterium]|nr:ribonuclease PH [Bdellovibrionales bacterium]